jgi:isopentenyldiphosphate isomerase
MSDQAFFSEVSMEFFDVVDLYGTPTGETVERAYAHAHDIRHRTAHIWIVRRAAGRIQILLQKRSADKDSFPGKYDTSSAGHISAGHEPLESALRELSEELGIVARENQLTFAGTFDIHFEKEFHGKMFRDNEIAFVYVYDSPVDIEKLVLQSEEVERVDWFDLRETYDACVRHEERFCVAVDGLSLLISCLDKSTSV